MIKKSSKEIIMIVVPETKATLFLFLDTTIVFLSVEPTEGSAFVLMKKVELLIGESTYTEELVF